ncbi:hypothetical protein HPB50_029210 [Hyalomma asiaticum]|nr:hypothetical protein HPB50_029210 [Hyalomma asiaticum]
MEKTPGSHIFTQHATARNVSRNYSRNCEPLYHMVWGCRNNPAVPTVDTSNVPQNPDDKREALLSSRNPENQLLLVDRVHAIAASLGYLERSSHPPLGEEKARPGEAQPRRLLRNNGLLHEAKGDHWKAAAAWLLELPHEGPVWILTQGEVKLQRPGATVAKETEPKRRPKQYYGNASKRNSSLRLNNETPQLAAIPQLCKKCRRAIPPVVRNASGVSQDGYIVVVKPRVPCKLRTFVPADRVGDSIRRYLSDWTTTQIQVDSSGTSSCKWGISSCPFEATPRHQGIHKGIININPAESPEKIKSEMHWPRGTILTVRKHGHSAAAVVTFEDTKLPYFLFYPYKKTVLVRTMCGTIRHRPPEYPHPTPTQCAKCGTTASAGLTAHDCHPKCLPCRGAHETGTSGCAAK